MRSKRRFLRILLYVAVGIGLAGYSLFATFLFNPLESDYGADVSTLVPRDVDYFSAKARIGRDVEGVARLQVIDRLDETEGGRTLSESPEGAALRERLEPLRRTVGEIESALARLPFDVDPWRMFGGEDLAIAGYFGTGGLDESRWAVLGRTNWFGKLALALLEYPGLLDLDSQGISIVETEGVYSLSGGALAVPALHVTRVQDVTLVSNSLELATAARELDVRKGQDSFGQSARYQDHVVNLHVREGDELEVFFDYRSMSERLGITKAWPAPDPTSFATTFLARIFQTSILKEVIGIVGFGGGVAVDLHADLSSEKLTAYQKRLYRTRGFDRAQAREVASYAPADSALFVYAHADLGDLLREAFAAVDRDTQNLINDHARTVWGHRDVNPLIDELDATFRDRFALVVRPNDYPVDPEIPSDGRPTFAWALIGWIQNEEKVDELRTKIVANQASFGIRGRNPGEGGVFSNEVQGGIKVYEYWIQLVPGTGHVATVVDAGVFAVSNNHLMLGHVLECYRRTAGRPNLADRGTFSAYLTSGLPNAGVLCWVDPSTGSATMRKLLREQAEIDVEESIDWDVERPRIDREVLARHFGGRSESELGPEESERFLALSNEQAEAFEESVLARELAGAYARYERAIVYAEEVRAFFAQLAFDPKRLDLAVRARMPLEPVAP